MCTSTPANETVRNTHCIFDLDSDSDPVAVFGPFECRPRVCANLTTSADAFSAADLCIRWVRACRILQYAFGLVICRAFLILRLWRAGAKFLDERRLSFGRLFSERMSLGVESKRDERRAWGEFTFRRDIGCGQLARQCDRILSFNSLEPKFCDGKA
jgi:hypothetical protein